MITDVFVRATPSFAELRRRLSARIREVTGNLHERRPMSTASLIGIGSLIVAFLVLALGLVANYGAWQHATGASEATAAALAAQVATLQKEKEEKAQQVAVLTAKLEFVTASEAATNSRLDTQVLEMQTLREKLAENGWRPLATRR